MPSLVAAGATEPIGFEFYLNSNPKTGSTLAFEAWRFTGGGATFQKLDFADMTFKTPALAEAGTPRRALTEVDATYAAGLYADLTGGLNLAAITNMAVGTAAVPAVVSIAIFEVTPSGRMLDIDDVVVGVVAATYADAETIKAYGAPPSAAAIGAQVTADHGAGSYLTASLAGIALATDVTASTAAVNAHTDVTAAPIAADTAYLVERQLCRREMDAAGVVHFYNAAGVEVATSTTADVDGNPITPAAGEPARAAKEVAVP